MIFTKFIGYTAIKLFTQLFYRPIVLYPFTADTVHIRAYVLVRQPRFELGWGTPSLNTGRCWLPHVPPLSHRLLSTC